MGKIRAKTIGDEAVEQQEKLEIFPENLNLLPQKRENYVDFRL